MSYGTGDAWRDQYLGTYDGYVELSKAFAAVTYCEPKAPQFPFQPKLCRRWWLEQHQKTCGNVTDEALKFLNRPDPSINAR